MDLIPELDSGAKGPETESKTTKRPRSLSQDESTLPSFRPPMRAFQLATNAISDTNDFSSNALRDRTSRTSHEFPVPFTRPSPTEPKPNTSNSTADPDPSVAKFAFKPRLIKPLPKAPKAFLQSEQASRTKSKPEVLRASDTSPMAKAYAELSKLRAELSAGAERQNAILEELQKMGAEDVILKPMRAVVAGTAKEGDEMTIDANASEVARTRLRLIEQQIEIEQRKKNIAVQELKAVEREGREPFVVPALLEAFIKLSELTTEAKERISAVAI
ncbi:hypothetical protein BT96DRAFT_913738 [Gymnopus androsaceus JB14]|uniref:Uncharacterized protein n=1 Tax=Gymnopus androsaceus JB14 TaxID=1447944 RepID=A0A6A4IFQ9_9AGAR|nr:hypothetical protein BT96DRAFT_913738 [Gymnopus androsaceus JB14]